MKSDSFRNNRKALAALLLCSSFITGCPLAVMAEGNETNLEVVQQQIKVSGVVKDAMGEPVIGASIQEKGTSNGIITDINGNFSLSVNQGATLVISYIGFKTQEVNVAGKKSFTIQLVDDTQALEEVVVVGYGVQRKSDLTGAVASVKGSEVLKNAPAADITSSLQGRLAGVSIVSSSGQPGSSSTIRVRGMNSVQADSGPLVVIDGFIGGSLSSLNPSDIASIEVLKDAAATALYGARANNGVVLVTTKSGHVGKTTVTLNVNIGKGFARDNYDFMNARDYLYWERMAAKRSGDDMNLVNGWGTGNDITADGNKSSNGIYSTSILTDKNKYLLDYGWQSMKDPASDNYLLFKETDFMKLNTQDAWTQDYNVSFSGGNDKGKYYSSIGYYDETGFPLESGYQRLSFNLNGEYKIKSWLKASGFVNFSRSETNPNYMSDANFWSVVAAAPPTFKGANLDGTVITLLNNTQNANWNEMKNYYYRRNTAYKTTLGTSFQVDLMKGLSLKLSGMWYLWMKTAVR